MVSFEYGNARLRAMKARLFSEQQLAELTAAGSVAAFLNALAKTAYRPVVEAALLHHQELAALHQAMRRDLIATAAKLHTFFSEREKELVTLVLCRYDVQNVKTTLRGLARHLPSEEILNATLPLGDLLSPELMALAGSEDVRAAVDLLATWLFPAASIVRQNLASSAAMEVALERWYVQMVLASPAAKGTILPEAIKLEADVMNILTALRLADVATKQPGEMDPLLAQLFGTTDLTAQFVGPGQIPLPLLVEAAEQPTLAHAVTTLSARLAATPYSRVLQAALATYQAMERVGEFEHAMECMKLAKVRMLIARDPLGIGVLWGYLALKTAEITNLRLIGTGLALHDPPQDIQRHLIVPRDV